MDAMALSTSVTASAVASSAARGALRGIWTLVRGFELELEGGGGEAALDAGEEVASALGRLAVEKRRRCRSVEGLGGPRGRRKGRIGWARAILNLQSPIRLPNYRLISSTGASFRVVVMSAQIGRAHV